MNTLARLLHYGGITLVVVGIAVAVDSERADLPLIGGLIAAFGLGLAIVGQAATRETKDKS